MGNPAKQIFTSSGTWTAPAGVTQATVVAQYSPASIQLQFGASLALTPNGAAYGWGLNESGNAGNGNTSVLSSPVPVVGSLQFSQIAVNSTSLIATSYGINQNGLAYAWGDNSTGQIGDGTTVPKSSPVAVAGGLTFCQLATPGGPNTTNTYVVGLAPNGSAYAWGQNTNGNLGDNTRTSRSSPVAVVGGNSFSRLFVDNGGGNSVYATTSSGSLFAWGINSSGQLGDNSVSSRSSPVTVVGGLSFSQISANNSSVVGITTAGVPYAWGANANGQLGLNDVTSRSSPVAIVGGLTFSQVLTVSGVSFGLTPSGTLYGWGLNTNGVLGLGDVTSRSSPVAVAGGLTFSTFHTNGQSTWGITTSGSMFAWGFNNNGQLGTGNVTQVSSPVAVVGGISWASIAPIADNSRSILAMGNNGQVYGWGSNGAGQLGTGDTNPRSSPVAVVGAFAASVLPFS